MRSEVENYDSDNLNAWTEFQYVNYLIYFSLISILLILNCFADKTPRVSTFEPRKVKNPSPEKKSSFLNQISFNWFTYTTYIGFRRPLTENDMYDIHPENMSRELVPPFDRYFAESVEKGRRYEI